MSVIELDALLEERFGDRVLRGGALALLARLSCRRDISFTPVLTSNTENNSETRGLL